MPVTVEREFSSLYDPYVGRISIYPLNKHVLIVDVINLIIDPGLICIHVDYPENMQVYDAVVYILDSLTQDFGHNSNKFVYDFKDCVFDSVTQLKYQFDKSTTDMLFPIHQDSSQYVTYGALDSSGNLTYTHIGKGCEVLVTKEVFK